MNMAHQKPGSDQLIDLLARQWTLSSAVKGAVFSCNSGAVAFDCSDGSVSVVTTKDPESATRRMRRAADTGNQTIRPRKGKVAPVHNVTCPVPRSSLVVGYGKRNFLFGTANGQLAMVTPQGSATMLDTGATGPVVAVAAIHGGPRLCYAMGRHVALCEDKGLKPSASLQMASPVVAMAFSPDGTALAVAHETGIAVLDVVGTPELRQEYPLDFAPQDICWSVNAHWIAATLGSHGAALANLQSHEIRRFKDFPIAVNSLSFSAVANAIAISGAFRAAAWSLSDLRTNEETSKAALGSGHPGLVPVDSVSACPTRNILAVGYSSGLLNLTQIGSKEEMLLDRDTGTGISSLTWAGNGNFLAIGRTDGTAALVDFPKGMFK